MVLSALKFSQSPSQTKTVITSVFLASCFVLLVTATMSSLSPLRIISRDAISTVSSKSSCPIIVYNKQIKTGSTVIANVLYRTTEAYGCCNAGCKLHQLLMNGNASHIGARNGVTLTCHAQEKNTKIVPQLRATHGKELAYIASVREPLGWFKSTACFFYKQNVDSNIKWTDESFKTVIDWLLEPEEYEPLEAFLFRSLGLHPNNTKREMLDKLVSYDLIIDHAKMNEGLSELGTLLGWKLLKPSHAKGLTYRGLLYDTYRADDIKRRTSRVSMLYEAATEIREAKYERPAFAQEEAIQIRNG